MANYMALPDSPLRMSLHYGLTEMCDNQLSACCSTLVLGIYQASLGLCPLSQITINSMAHAFDHHASYLHWSSDLHCYAHMSQQTATPWTEPWFSSVEACFHWRTSCAIAHDLNWVCNNECLQNDDMTPFFLTHMSCVAECHSTLSTAISA